MVCMLMCKYLLYLVDICVYLSLVQYVCTSIHSINCMGAFPSISVGISVLRKNSFALFYEYLLWCRSVFLVFSVLALGAKAPMQLEDCSCHSRFLLYVYISEWTKEKEMHSSGQKTSRFDMKTLGCICLLFLRKMPSELEKCHYQITVVKLLYEW